MIKYLFILLFIVSLTSCSDLYYTPTPEPFVIHTYRAPGPYYRMPPKPQPRFVPGPPRRGMHFRR